MTFSTTYQKVNSSIVSKGAINSIKEILPPARMFPLAVMHRVLFPSDILKATLMQI